MRQLLILLMLGTTLLLKAQLPWVVPPVIEDTVFFYLPETSKNLIVLGKKPAPQRIQRTDGSYLFNGQVFKRLQGNGANGVWSGLTLDDEPVVFNEQEVLLSKGYDELNSHYRSNILMTKKDNLFGLITAEGKVIKKAKFKNMRRKQQGLYLGEYPNGTMEEIALEETSGLTEERRASALSIHSNQLKDRIMVRKRTKDINYPFWGMTDMEGNEVLPANRYYSNYSKMHFEQQVMIAIDSQNDKEGALDKDGKVIIPFVYDKVSRYLVNGQYCIAEKADTSFLVDFKGQVQAYIIGSEISGLGKSELIREKRGEEYRILKLDLTPVTPEVFSYISSPFDNGFLMVTQEKKSRFFLLQTQELSSTAFAKVNGSYALPPLAAREVNLFGLYDPYDENYLVAPKFVALKRNGAYFRGVYITHDTTRLEGDSLFITSIKLQQVFHESGRTVLGPSKHNLQQLSGPIWQEQITKDSLVLHNLETAVSRPLNKVTGQAYGDIVEFTDNTYAFTTDYLSAPPLVAYEFLDREQKDHSLRRYQRDGKFGLMHGRELITKPIYDEVDLKFIRYGIKARVGNKWGVLAKPESL